jgi:AcrR family transcriptional regulator
MSKKKQMSGEDRKASILEAGARLAAKHGAINVTRRMVAKAANVSEALVSSHMGDTASAQAAYKRKMKKLGLEEPSKDKIEAIGVKLRAHGPRDKRDTRKRSAKEVEAIKRKRATPGIRKDTKPNKPKLAAKVLVTAKTNRDGATTVTAKSRRSGVDLRKHTAAIVQAITPGPKERKPAKPRERKPKAPPVKPQPGPAENKVSAARKPKAPPPNYDANRPTEPVALPPPLAPSIT